jgi:hypothetical protein
LSGLATGGDVFELTALVADLHLKHDTFPGEAFMDLAGRAYESEASFEHSGS